MKKLLILPLAILMLNCSKKDVSPAVEVKKVSVDPMSRSALIAFAASLKDYSPKAREVAIDSYFRVIFRDTVVHSFRPSAKNARTENDPFDPNNPELQWTYPFDQYPSLGPAQIEDIGWGGTPRTGWKEFTWTCAENIIGLWSVQSKERAYGVNTTIYPNFTNGFHIASWIEGLSVFVTYTESGATVDYNSYSITPRIEGTLGPVGFAAHSTFSIIVPNSRIWPAGSVDL